MIVVTLARPAMLLAPPATKQPCLRGTADRAKAERQNVMVPDEDPDYGFLGPTWPWQERDPDAILQPPKPELRSCGGIQRLTGYEPPDREAAD